MKKFNLFLIFGLLFIVLSNSVLSTGSLYTGVKDIYKFENTSVFNNIGGSSGSTLADLTASGKSGNALDYEASNNDYSTATANNNITGSYAISFWVKHESIGTMVVMEGTPTASYDGQGYHLITATNRQFGMNDLDTLIINSAASTGVWYNYVLNCYPGGRDIYVNGVNTSLSTKTIGGSCIFNKNRGWGRRSATSTFYFDGIIDEYYVWDRTLTQSEITALQTEFYPFITAITNTTLTAKNYWDNSSINKFNASITFKYISNSSVSSIIKGTSNGVLQSGFGYNTTGCYKTLGSSATKINCLVNITYFNITTHFNQTYYNHNISSTRIGYMKQSQVNVSVRELFTNNSISNVVIKINGTTKVNTTNSWGLIYPNKNTNYVITVFDRNGVEQYHATSNRFNVSYLQNNTKYVYVHQHYIIIKARNAITNASINTFNVTINSLNVSDTRNVGTTTGTLNIPVIHNTYNATIIAPNYALYNNTKQFIITTNQTYTFRLYANNSITFNIYNLTSLQLTNKTINIQMIGEHSTYNYVTSNGTKFTGTIIPDVTYRVVFTSTSFNTQTQYITLLGGEHRNVNVYMDSGLTSKSFNVKDATNNLNLEGVVLTFYELINGSQVSVGQLTTDYFGSGAIFLSSSKSYSFTATRTNYTDFTGTITPSENSYSFSMNRVVGTEFDSVFNSIYMPSPTFNYYPLQGKAFNSYTLTSSQGVVTYFGYNYTYDGIDYIENLSTSPLGGIITDNFTVNLVAQNNVTITYFYKITGNDLYSFDRNYFMGYTPENFTLAGGIFDDLEDLSGTSGYWKGIVAYIIIVGLIVVLLKLTGSLNIAILGGLIGFGIAWSYNLLPRNLILLSAGIIIFFWIVEKAWAD